MWEYHCPNEIFLPSILRGKHKNTHLQSQQKLDNLLVFLQSMIQYQVNICKYCFILTQSYKVKQSNYQPWYLEQKGNLQGVNWQSVLQLSIIAAFSCNDLKFNRIRAHDMIDIEVHNVMKSNHSLEQGYDNNLTTH